MGPRASQDLRSPSPIMAPGETHEVLIASYNLTTKPGITICRHIVAQLHY